MPTDLLKTLSPIAAKVYIALSTLTHPNVSPPTAQISLQSLAALTNTSERSCTNAFRQLQNLGLIARRPSHAHAPRIYEILPFPYSQPIAIPTPDLHPDATLTRPDSQSVATMNPADSQPAAILKSKNPISTPKTHNAHPDAPNSTLTLTPTERALLADPHIQKILLAALLPSKEPAHVGNHSNV